MTAALESRCVGCGMRCRRLFSPMARLCSACTARAVAGNVADHRQRVRGAAQEARHAAIATADDHAPADAPKGAP